MQRCILKAQGTRYKAQGRVQGTRRSKSEGQRREDKKIFAPFRGNGLVEKNRQMFLAPLGAKGW